MALITGGPRRTKEPSGTGGAGFEDFALDKLALLDALLKSAATRDAPRLTKSDESSSSM